MATLFHDLPRDPETVAAVRRFCDEQGFPSGCAEKICRQSHQCRGRWSAAPDNPQRVLPPCLGADLDRRIETLCAAEEAFFQLKLAMAQIRKLPNPEELAEADFFDADEAAVYDAYDPDEAAEDVSFDPWGDDARLIG